MALVVEDGVVIKNTVEDFLWAGMFSEAHSKGAIVAFVQACAPKNTVVFIPKSDGQDNQIEFWKTELEEARRHAIDSKKTFIMGVLSNKTQDPATKYLYLPLDDTFFEQGVDAYFQEKRLPWEERSSSLCWRGGCSGGGMGSVRARFVEKIYSEYSQDTDVRLSRWWSEADNFPDHLFAPCETDRIPYKTFLQDKIFFVVDGNVIASNHMYGFATGCVPFLLSNGVCWFSHLIEPFVHYVPVRYDLSDLIERIEWVKANDDKARIIALNAVDFSKAYFSSEYQHKYIQEKLAELCR